MKKKWLIIFYIILLIIWIATDYREPVEDPPPEIIRRVFPTEKTHNFPNDFIITHNSLANLFEDATSRFTHGNVPVLLLPDFVMATGDSTPVLLDYIKESAFSYLYNDPKVRVVRRNYDSDQRSRIRGNYILIGRVSTFRDQIRITVRIQDVNTGEILDAFDEFVPLAQVSSHL